MITAEQLKDELAEIDTRGPAGGAEPHAPRWWIDAVRRRLDTMGGPSARADSTDPAALAAMVPR